MQKQSFAEWLRDNREARRKQAINAMYEMWREPGENGLTEAQRRVAALFGRRDGAFTFTEEQGTTMSHFDDEDTQKRTSISTFTSEHARITKERALEQEQAQNIWSWTPDNRSLEELQSSVEKLLLNIDIDPEETRATGPLANDDDNDQGALVCA